VAMGNCAVNNIDAQSALYNPGAMGLFYLDKNFSFSLPNNSMWLKEITNNLRIKTFGFGGGVSLKQLNKSFHNKFNASLSLAYSRQKITYGEMTLVDNNGIPVGYEYPFEKGSFYTIGLGFEFYARVGIGYTIKKIHSELGSVFFINREVVKTTAHDIGIITDLPLGKILPLNIPIGENKNHTINFDLTPSYAYVKANSGDDFAYRSETTLDKLPEIKRMGSSFYGGINFDQSLIISYRLVKETEEDLVDTDAEDIEKEGKELGLFGILFYRWGKYEDSFGHIDIKTHGYAINLKNIIKWFDTVGPGYTNKTARYITDHFDFVFEYASYDNEEDEVYSNMTFIKLSFSF
ncbi:MAG: hypothetical protein ABIJ12_05135, partial [bacterium]